jgi:hypothetical protein
MTVEPIRVAPATSHPAVLQAHRDAIRRPRVARLGAWRQSKMALLAGELWLLVAVVIAAAGDGSFGILFAGTAVLWIWVAAVGAEDAHSLSTARKLQAHSRGQAIPFGS